MKTLKISLLLLGAILISSCSGQKWTKEEKQLIKSEEAVLPIYSCRNEGQLAVLRKTSLPLPSACLGRTYRGLESKLLSTLASCRDGVGLAAPQVGISRRVVAVQRFDKQGEPVEVYPNIEIVAVRGDKVRGTEGCLSVPNRFGDVERYRDIDIRYISPKTRKKVVETVQGYTAVIFQHEVDHLDGILYTDKEVPWAPPVPVER